MGTTGQSITLANSIIGVGILAMPFCFQQCGVLLATLILLLMGLVSRLCCYFLLKSALIARRRNFEFLAFHVFGSAGKLGVELGIIGFLMGTCIAYFVVVGDLGPQIISKMFNINQSDILRTSIMVIVSLVCVLPLGLLRNVDSLSNVSAATIGFYFCLVIKVISEAASQMLASDWDRRVVMWRPAGVLQCVPIFSMALFCQTQLFEIFESLPTLSLEKMNVVTKNAINICTAVYFTLGLFGYIAFCSHEISGNILMSLSPTMASDVIKLGFVMSVAFSFPLIIFPCRASLYSFLYKKVHLTHHDHIINHSIPETTFRCITVAIIAVALFISLLIPNIELVLGLVGSTIGVLICVVFPAACFVNVTFKNTNERVLAKAVLILGLVIMVLGTYANLQAAESRLDRYDDKITPERIDKIVEDFFQKMEKNGDFKAHIPNEVISHKEANKDEKDSEVQPPNPVPPESSNEKNSIGEKPNIDKKVKPDLPNVENVADKVSESHPKNVQNKLNGAKSNEEKLDENKIIDKPVLEIEKPNLEQKTQDKIDMMKQQQLIETIKQHGMEQKELIKEQKEILNEIIKTKKELQQNKKDIGSEEAKKIAVESIQKIANRAIQSLINVSDKPAVIENGDKKSDPLEKIANEAVQDIAKKAAETIEAIEVKENLKEPVLPEIKQDIANIKVPMPNAQSSSNVNQVPVQNNAQINSETIQNVNPQANVNNINQANIPPVVQNVAPPVQTLKQNDLPINQIPSVNNVPPVQPAVNPNSQLQVPNYNIPNQPAQSGNQNIPPEQNQVKRDTVLSQDHSHSPDEPQSYKQGEDSQKKNDINKVPLPVAINSNSQIIGNSQVNGNSQINANPQVNGNSQINGVPQVNGNPQINANRPETDNFKIIANPQVNGNTQVNGNSQINSNPQVNEDLQGNGNSQINANPIVNGNSQINTNPQVNDNSQINENLKIDNNIKGDSKINKQENQVPIVNTNKPDTIQSKEPVNKDMNLQNNLNIVQNNGAIKNIIDNNIVETQDNKLPIRQKREVIDCTEKHILKREDKKICDTLVSSGRGNEISEEVLPSKVDLNDAIKNHLPVGAMMHHMRSLKSYDATGKKR